jgi:hypothetical protein
MYESFFAAKHEKLKDDYREDSGARDSCSHIAFKLADLLQEEGYSPNILVLRGAAIDDGHREGLVPLCYEGRIEWTAHVVCAVEGWVYDPLLENPLPLEEYLSVTFDQPVEVREFTKELGYA